MREQDFDYIAEQEEQADTFAFNLNRWFDCVLDLGYEFTTDGVYRAVVELGYYEGFQVYVEDVDGKHGENLLDGLEKLDNLPMERDQAQKLIEKVYLTAQFILIDYAKNNGLGRTAGGWAGGSAQFNRVDQVCEYYKQGADAELLAEWERLSK